MRILTAITAMAALGLTAGCQQPAKKNPQQNNKPQAAQTVSAPVSTAQSAQVKAGPKRRLVIDEKGNAYEVLEEHERLCQNCDR